MAFYSSKLISYLAGRFVTLTAATISFTAAGSVIADSGNGLLTAGFCPGNKFNVSGTVSNDGLKTVVSVASDGSSMVVSETLVNESAGSTFTLTGGISGVLDLMQYGVIELRSGPMPTSADAVPTGNVVALLTINGGAFTKGTSTNGILLKLTTDYLGVELDTGGGIPLGTGLISPSAVVGYGVFYRNNYKTTGSGADEARAFLSAGTTSTAEIRFADSASIAFGQSFPIGSLTMKFRTNSTT